MTDAEKREKVISDVIWAFAEWENNLCCPGEDWSDVHQSRDMVIALLKAQEPREPTLDIRHGKSMWRCGSCSTALQPNQINAKFCFNCGRAVKWE